MCLLYSGVVCVLGRGPTWSQVLHTQGQETLAVNMSGRSRVRTKLHCLYNQIHVDRFSDLSKPRRLEDCYDRMQ